MHFSIIAWAFNGCAYSDFEFIVSKILENETCEAFSPY